MKNSGQTEENNRNAGILSTPLSFIHNGVYNCYDANFNSRGGGGYSWSLQSYSKTGSDNLGFSDSYLNPQSANNRGIGFAVRCLGFF